MAGFLVLLKEVHSDDRLNRKGNAGPQWNGGSLFSIHDDSTFFGVLQMKRFKKRRRNRLTPRVESLETRKLFSVNQTLIGDADCNGVVEFADFLALSTNFGLEGAGWSQGDFDGDGTVAFSDFLGLSGNFGQTEGPSDPVESPENAVALGQAEISGDGGDILVTNIGGSGQDGVALLFEELQETVAFPITTGGVLLSDPGSRIAIEAIATVDGVSEIPAGFAAVENIGGALEVSAQFSYGADIPEVLVQVFDDGEFVGQEVTEGGLIGTVPEELGIFGFGKLFPAGPFEPSENAATIDPFDPRLSCYWIDFSDRFLLETVNGQTLEGSQVRLLVPPGGFSGNVESYSELQLTAQNVDVFGVTIDQNH